MAKTDFIGEWKGFRFWENKNLPPDHALMMPAEFLKKPGLTHVDGKPVISGHRMIFEETPMLAGGTYGVSPCTQAMADLQGIEKHLRDTLIEAAMLKPPAPILVGVDFGREDLTAYTTATVAKSGNDLTLEIINNALLTMAENRRAVEEDRPMTATEVRQRLWRFTERASELRDGWARTWGQLAHDLGAYGVAGLIWEEEKTWRPRRARRFRWSGRLPDTITFRGMTAHLIADNQAAWDESDRMGHCLYRNHRVGMYQGFTVAYHIDHPPHLDNFKNGITVTAEATFPVDTKKADPHKRCSMTVWEGGRWTVNEIRGRANTVPSDRMVQEFADYIAATVESFLSGKVLPAKWQGLGYPFREENFQVRSTGV